MGKGEHIVSEEWIVESTQKHSNGGPPSGEAYGYLWWVTEIKDYSAYFAMGYGGQFIYVLPELDVVAVVTSDIMQGHHEENRAIVAKHIIPAIKQ